ncbi:arrestin domain-containing protein 1a [Scleropages formosus]|uniref:Arrestin domain containing 1 n=1 Tax=Scleropages formosus TaxID=113540 RepID=A0A8C9RU70_SCLFO|nr:arrestin domain-containing protein 1-like [Scleropages formosus]
MGKLQEFGISFTNNKTVYSPGESISGSVRIVLGQPLQCKAVKVNCLGTCGVSSRMNDTTWDLQEQYFSSTLSLADKGTLTKGEHSLPFQFLIPVSAPTSYEGAFGKIVYRLKATIDTPRFSKDYETQMVFFLLRHLNLNEVAHIEQPSSAQTTKKFTYLLVKTGTIVLKAQSDMRGYTPGQVIKLTAHIQNMSGKDTGYMVASLMQKVTYKTKRPTCDERMVAEVEGAGVKAGKNVEWKEQIIVPALPQSGLAGCNLITIDYFVQVSVKSPEVSVRLPIYIGNIPVSCTPRTPVQPVLPTPAPCTTPAPVPLPRSRSHGVAPTAPPAEEAVSLVAAGIATQEVSTKNHSQQDPWGCQPVMSPSSFTHTPSQVCTQAQLQRGTSATSGPLSHVSTGPTAPIFSEGNSTPVRTVSPLILPPEYSTAGYPQEPPPTYEESCDSNGGSGINAGGGPASRQREMSRR